MKGYNIVIHITADDSEKANAIFFNSNGMDGFQRLKHIIMADKYLNSDKITIHEMEWLKSHQKSLLESVDRRITEDKFSTQRALLLLEMVGAYIQSLNQLKECFMNQSLLFSPTSKGILPEGFSNCINTKIKEDSNKADGDIWYDMKTKTVKMNCFEYMSPYEFEEKYFDDYFADLNIYDRKKDITNFSADEIEDIETIFNQFPVSTEDGIVISMI